jgi:hypothetical protein
MDKLGEGTWQLGGPAVQDHSLYHNWPSNHYSRLPRSHIMTCRQSLELHKTMSLRLIGKRLRKPTRSRNLRFRVQSAALLTGLLTSLALIWSCSAVVKGSAATSPPPLQTHIISEAISPVEGRSGAKNLDVHALETATTGGGTGSFKSGRVKTTVAGDLIWGVADPSHFGFPGSTYGKGAADAFGLITGYPPTSSTGLYNADFANATSADGATPVTNRTNEGLKSLRSIPQRLEQHQHSVRRAKWSA